MVVAVTPGLGVTALSLRALGYEVVEYGRYSYPIDAIVYTGAYLSEPSMHSGTFGEGAGVLMINAGGRNVSEIDNMLKKHTYSPLF